MSRNPVDGGMKGGGEEKINCNKQNKVPEREREREAPGRRGGRVCALNGWKTLNENDLEGTRRVGGCQVRACRLGTCVFLCLLVLHGYPAVRIIAGVERRPVFPDRSSAVPVGHNGLNNCLRQPRRSAPALIDSGRSPAFPHKRASR